MSLFLIFHFIIHPLLRDIVWILAKNNPANFLDVLYVIFTVGIVIIGIIVTVFVAGSTAKNAKERLDIDAALEEYFEERDERNPYMDMDMSDVEVDFSRLSTKAKLILTSQSFLMPELLIRAAQ